MAESNEKVEFDDHAASNLSQLRLNNTGKNYIQRFYRLGNFILIANTITCIIFNFYIGYDILQAMTSEPGEESLSLPYLLYSGYSMIFNFINIVSVYFYVRFTKKIKASIELNDEHGMNLSFRYFYSNALLFTISLILSLVSEVIYFMIR